jgi:superfamily II DNA/RNA helicase
VERIAQRIIHVDPRQQAEDAVRHHPGRKKSIAFWCSPAPSTAPTRWSAVLIKDGISAEAIHGNKSQNQRERVLKDFRNGRVKTLVATDIAARGIDVEGISHVINFDLPNIPESYVHRIGRTARAGADGIAISLCSHDELPFLRDIEKLIRMAIPATGQSSQPRPAQRPAAAASRPPRPAAAERPARNGQAATGPATNAADSATVRSAATASMTSMPSRTGQSRHQGPHSNAGQGSNQGPPRPIASTQPVGADFAKVSFMQPR